MRTFIAIDIPEDVREKIYSVSDHFIMPGINVEDKEKLHITLHFLGETDESKIHWLEEGLSKVVKVKQFEIALRGLGYFDPKMLKVIYASVTKGEDELKSLHAQTSGFLKEEGFKVESNYVPHVTIARVKWTRERERLLEMIKQNLDAEFGSFTATSIKIKSSKPSDNGMVYDDLFELHL